MTRAQAEALLAAFLAQRDLRNAKAAIAAYERVLAAMVRP